MVRTLALLLLIVSLAFAGSFSVTHSSALLGNESQEYEIVVKNKVTGEPLQGVSVVLQKGYRAVSELSTDNAGTAVFTIFPESEGAALFRVSAEGYYDYVVVQPITLNNIEVVEEDVVEPEEVVPPVVEEPVVEEDEPVVEEPEEEVVVPPVEEEVVVPVEEEVVEEEVSEEEASVATGHVTVAQSDVEDSLFWMMVLGFAMLVLASASIYWYTELHRDDAVPEDDDDFPHLEPLTVEPKDRYSLIRREVEGF